MSRAGLIAAIVLSCLLACGLHILLLEDGFYAATMDDHGRTLDALQWSQGKGSLAGVWLPFHRVIVGTALRIWPDLLVTPRVISGVCGILVLLAVCWLAHELFRRRAVTAIAAILGALLPVRVILGIAPLSEIMYLALLLAGVASLARWRRTVQSGWLILGAAFLTVASSVRYEGWLFVFLLPPLLIRVPGRLAVKLIAAAVALSFPLFWMALHALEHGSALAFFANPIDRYSLVVGDIQSHLILNNPLVQLLGASAITLNILGVLAVPSLWREERCMKWVLLLLFLSLVLLAAGALFGRFLPTHNSWRIAAPWLLFLVPLTAAWIVDLVQSEGSHGVSGSWQGAFFLLLVAGMFGWETYRATRVSALTRFDIEAGRFLEKEFGRLGPADASTALIESGSWAYAGVLVSSQCPDRFVLNTGGDPMHPSSPIWNLDTASVPRMRRMRVRFIVAQWFENQALLRSTPSITPLAEFGPWTIYRLSGGDSTAPAGPLP